MPKVSSGQLEKWNRLLDPAKPEQLIFEDVEGEEGIDLDDEEEEEVEISPRSEEGEDGLDVDEEELEESDSEESSSGNTCSVEHFGRVKTSAYR